MGAFVYMLRCADGSYYVGSATGDDLTWRIAEHQSGYYQGYTSTRRPVQLVWSEHFLRITDAIAVERQLKGWSRAKKEALITGDWSMIQMLSRRRAGGPRPEQPFPATTNTLTHHPEALALASASTRVFRRAMSEPRRMNGP